MADRVESFPALDRLLADVETERRLTTPDEVAAALRKDGATEEQIEVSISRAITAGYLPFGRMYD